MKIALIGATGFVGAAILQEALNRSHDATAIVRNPEKLQAHRSFTPRRAMSTMKMTSLVSWLATRWSSAPSARAGAIPTSIISRSKAPEPSSTEKAGIKRLLLVGGAGSLEVKTGVQSVDLPGFPAEYKQGALATREALTMLGQETGLEWSYLSPSADLFPCQRTGKFRLGTDQLLKDANGESRISVQDYAMAMIDEVEKPNHIRRRFTVGY
jgi:putative NADH-flavin reductase